MTHMRSCLEAATQRNTYGVVRNPTRKPTKATDQGNRSFIFQLTIILRLLVTYFNANS